MDALYQRDWNISFVRMISMLMIISCHVCQYFGNELAWWLNCGVQIFLFISGFLYGQKKIESSYPFLKKQIPKILLEFYASVVFTIVVYFFFAREVLVFDKVIKLIFLGGTLEGIGQVWFVSTIVFCYILTPIFSVIIEKIVNNNKRNLRICMLLLIVHIEITLIIPYYTPAWINCYILGLVIGKLRSIKWKGKWWKNTSKICIPLGIVLNIIQILQDYIIRYPLDDRAKIWYRLFCNYAHVFLGITVFLILYKGFEWFARKKKSGVKLLEVSDKYSYAVFLAHNMWLNSSTVCIWETIFPRWVQCILIVLLILLETVFIILFSKGTRALLARLQGGRVKYEEFGNVRTGN